MNYFWNNVGSLLEIETRIDLIETAHQLVPEGIWAIRIEDGYCTLNWYHDSSDLPTPINSVLDKINPILSSEWQHSRTRNDQYCKEIDWRISMQGKEPTIICLSRRRYDRDNKS